MSGHWPRSISLAAASDYFFILVDSGQKTGIKRGFRALRSASQGSALRTRSLSRKAGESFNMGAVLIYACERDLFTRLIIPHRTANQFG